MTRKQKTYKELDTEKTRGRKRYLERIIEDQEAKQRVEEYLDYPEQEETYEDRPVQRPFN